MILEHEYSYVKKTRINEEISRAHAKQEIEFWTHIISFYYYSIARVTAFNHDILLLCALLIHIITSIPYIFMLYNTVDDLSNRT